MKATVLFKIILIIALFPSAGIKAQDHYLNSSVGRLIDSLDRRGFEIQQELPRLAKKRNAVYYFKKRELDITLFLSEYHKYIFDEELAKARNLIDSRLKAVQKRRDTEQIDFYNEYNSLLTIEMGRQRAHYQELFKKEKNFKKELFKFLDEGTEYSFLRAKRMAELAIKYATEQKFESILPYLENYRQLTKAIIFDYYSVYDLKKITNSESVFQKDFKPLVESDSIGLIKKAGELVDHCYTYSANTLSILDTGYFTKQKMVVSKAISDYDERQGNKQNMSNMAGQAIIVRFDSLNKEGVYKWHENIIVIGTVKLTAKFDNVKRGEAIIDADRTLVQYIKVNKLAKISRQVKMGSTYIVPYVVDDKKTDFQYNPIKNEHQYMICYTRIDTKFFTKGIIKFLPPMQFIYENNVSR